MPSGGARARSGPPPDPNALRRDRKSDQATWTLLPASGRKGVTPKWPLPDPTARELAQWRKEWRRPQAIEWERNGQQDEIAVYVRTLVHSTKGDPNPQLFTLLLRQQTELGLNMGGLLKNHWRIVDDAAPATRTRGDDTDRTATKASLRTIIGGAA